MNIGKNGIFMNTGKYKFNIYLMDNYFTVCNWSVIEGYN